MDHAKALIDKYTPESMQEKVKNLGNNELVVLASVLNGIKKDYINEDSLPNGGGRTNNTKDDYLSQARELRKSEAYKNVMHPEHDKTKAQVDELYRLGS